MDLSLLDLRHDAPGRRPDWRWRLAGFLINNPDERLARELADRRVVGAYRLLRDLQRPPAEQLSPGTALLAAYEIHTDEDQMRRWVVEARLLTQEPLEQIASRCGLSTEVLTVYADLFFDVRDRLDA